MKSGFTDADGSYILDHRHTGPAELYVVEFADFGLNQLIQLKGNGWAEVSLDASTGTINATWTDTGGPKKRR